MNDTQFDNYFNNKLSDHAAPVPAGLWEKVVEGQFDQFVGGKLKDAEAPVPAGLWDKVSDGSFDNFVGNKLFDQTVPVPDGLWDKVSDGSFDNFIGEKLTGQTAPVPGSLWDKISDGQFDGFVAGKLINHEAPVPAGLWGKIRPDADDDRVGFIWFRYPYAAILLAVLLIAGTLGGYFFYTSQKKNASEQTQTDAAVQTTNSNINNNNTPDKKPVTGQDAGSKNDVTNSTTILPPVTGKDANNHQSQTTPSAASSDANSVGKQATTDEINSKIKSESNTNRSAINQGSVSSLTDVSVSAKKTKSKISLQPPVANNDITTNSYDLFKNNGAAVNKENEKTVTNDYDFTVEPYQQNLLTAVTIPSGLGKFNLSQRLLDKQLSTANHTNQFRNIIICPTDRKNYNTDWFLEAYASPDIAMKSVNNISASPLFLLKKDSSESMQVSYSAGLRLVKPITDNILLKAGIQYSQVNQKYVYRTENEVKTTTVVTQRTIIRGPGDTVVVKDTSTVQTIGFRNNTVYNRYRSFDIPLTVGYQFGNEDLKIGINAGVVVNLSSWYQGVILDSSLATVTLNKTGNAVYKTNIGIGLYGGISVVKRLSDDLHIFVEPYFRYNLSNMTTSQSKYNQKFNVGGLAIGLRLNLNRK